MAQGQIKKGFFFYFGLFVLLLITIFCVCLVIMMFNPGQTVLWMKYFTARENIAVLKTTDTHTDINWANVTNLKINCTYANVYVQRSSEYKNDGLYIVNEAKGFASAKTMTPFGYNVYYEGPTLVVDVTEPNGFMFFSKKIDIILHANGSTNFGNLNLSVETTEGNIEVGGTSANEGQTVSLGGLTAKTTKGDILIEEKFNTNSLNTLSMHTVDGRITSWQEISYANGLKGRGMVLNCDASLRTDKGLIDFDAINVGANNLEIFCKKGNVNIDYINAESVDVTCMQGNYRFGKVYANLNYSKSEDYIIAPNIVADYVDGNFTLSTNDTNIDTEPDIDIDEITGNVFILANKGDVDIKKVGGSIEISSQKNLSVNVVIDENNSSLKRIITNSGTVRVAYLGNVAGNTVIETTTGKIIVDVTSVARFTADAFLNDLEATTRVDNGKITISHGLAIGETKNPLNVQGTGASSGNIQIKTNSTINYNLVLKENLEI